MNSIDPGSFVRRHVCQPGPTIVGHASLVLIRIVISRNIHTSDAGFSE